MSVDPPRPGHDGREPTPAERLLASRQGSIESNTRRALRRAAIVLSVVLAFVLVWMALT